MKIICTNPKHNDTTPSMEVYDDGGFCFVCRFLDRTARYPENEVKQKTRENISETIAYIETLPRKIIRGLALPYDYSGYYLVWPDKSYYKKRLFRPAVESKKYYMPKGHKPKLLKLPGKGTRVVVCEGEFNAISLAVVYDGVIVSPGSANNLLRFLPEYLMYVDVVVIIDKDPAGVANGIELKKQLLRNNRNTKLLALEKDLNQILQDEGVGALKAWSKENLEMR